MATKNWFEVDRKGLKQLQEGKSKTFVVRELLQNAFDEDITKCTLFLIYNGYNKATIIVEDDSPIGFRDLTDAYTLYKETHKRKDATKRGRFNLGEKQVFAICEYAEILTTVGGVIFDEEGRKSLRKKRDRGSIITVTLKMSKEEIEECFDYAQNILFPKNIDFTINYSFNGGLDYETRTPTYNEPHKVFEASLKTELDFDGSFRPTVRKTNVHVHKTIGKKYLYELGLPICEIECDYSIDVQQKVPMSADRESVTPSFLKDLYAEVLNHTFEEITEHSSSNLWVREATASDRIVKEAVDVVVEKRFGDKVAIFSPSDPNANDEAISKGFRVIHGSELSGDEWSNVKGFGLIQSTTALFGKGLTNHITLKPSNKQERVGNWCVKFFKDFFGSTLNVAYISAPKASTVADFGDNLLRFNIPKMASYKWVDDDNTIGERMLDLVIHELAHKKGNHTEHAYHECITKMGAWLTKKALNNPQYFKL
jgi:hypothetical protein